MEGQNPASHYSTFSRVAAIAWIVIAVLLLLDVLWRGEGRASWIAGALLVASKIGRASCRERVLVTV